MKRLHHKVVRKGWRPLPVCLLLLPHFLGGCGDPESDPPPTPPTQVAIGKVSTGTVEETLAAVGTIEANEIVQLKPETPAVIRAIHFTEGQRVQRGQVLFELDAGKEAALVAQARAEEELARQNLERARTLIGTKAISKQELDQRESELAAKTASRQLQEEKLQDMRIEAPLEGVVGPREISVGQYVNAGQNLVTVVDSSRVKVTYRVPERELGRIRLNQQVKIQVAAYPDREFTGDVDLINPVVDPATRMAEIRARAPNPEDLLKPGMFARVETILEEREQAVVIPEGALIPSLSGFSVYTVQEGRAKLRAVRIGVRAAGTVEIREGLKPGEEIVVEGTQKLVDSTPIVAAQVPESESPQTTP